MAMAEIKTAASRAGVVGTRKKGTFERHCRGRLKALMKWAYGKGGEWKRPLRF